MAENLTRYKLQLHNYLEQVGAAEASTAPPLPPPPLHLSQPPCSQQQAFVYQYPGYFPYPYYYYRKPTSTTSTFFLQLVLLLNLNILQKPVMKTLMLNTRTKLMKGPILRRKPLTLTIPVTDFPKFAERRRSRIQFQAL